jgi:hypothetical protein
MKTRSNQLTGRVLTPSVPSWVGPPAWMRTNPIAVKLITRAVLRRAPLGEPIGLHSLALILDVRESFSAVKLFLADRIPWLWRLPKPLLLVFELRKYGFAALTADDHELIDSLATSVATDAQLVAQVLTCPRSRIQCLNDSTSAGTSPT